MTKYFVDVYQTLATVIEVEADNAAEAEAKAMETSIAWSLSDDLTDEVEATVSGERNKDGERLYYH
jgi:hypothetical protein